MFQSSAAPKGGCNSHSALPSSYPCSFQTSAAPKGGCNQAFVIATDLAFYLFQSSAAPKGGCNPGRRGSLSGRRGFNPQPPRRAAATPDQVQGGCSAYCFNPQPPRRAAATHSGSDRYPGTAGVSILSRPEGRLQRVTIGERSVRLDLFQSSAAP